MFYSLKQYLKKRGRAKRWRRLNLHNETSPVNDFDFSSVTVGKYTYGGIQVYNFNKSEKLKIGNYCSIASDVMFILNADHNISTISTFPFKAKCLFTEELEATSKGDIVVDDDVWIGYRATILSGVHIGQGAVIAAGAVVTKDVSPYAIVGGVPARVIKYRFSPEIIEKLMKIDYSKLDKEIVEKNIDKLYEPIMEDTDLSWLPQKN